MVRSLLILVAMIVPGGAAAQRLPLLATPDHYDIHVSPDLQAERFTGRVRIRVRVLEATNRLVVNATALDIHSALVRGGGQVQPARVTLDAATETATLRLPAPLAAGPAEIEIAYTGYLNRQLRGLYLSEANGRRYAVTQLEATDARRMFPSFDEPRYKATFALTAEIDAGDEAISNGAVAETRPGPGPGRKTVAFETTAPMSTYLVALAVGDFTCAGRTVGATPLRVCTTPAGRDLTAFSLEAAADLLAWMNGYFAIDYPFGKLDLVAIPDFAAGAMENTGAIFFRESLLLVERDASLAVRKRAAAVIAHELAHQWFGNLVTMRWWDDLWLNEGFATWMETKAVAAWRPEWRVDVDEQQATLGAMGIDSRASTRPVRTAAETPAEIGELFDPIAYEKAGAVLGMIESYIGDAAFQAGLNAYLAQHKYGVASSEQFWSVLARSSGRPVDRIMRSFIDTPGVPLVGLETACTAGDTHVTLTQERFAAAGRQAPPADALWAIPVCLETRGDGPADRCELLTERRAVLTLPGCARWVMGNRDAEGYYRTAHGPDARERLRRANAELDAGERLALIADEWALLRAGRADVTAFLEVATAFALDVRAPGVLEVLGTRLQFLHEYVATAESRPAFAAWVRRQFGPALPAPGEPAEADSDRERRRALLLALLGTAGEDPDVRASAREQVQRYLARATPQVSATLLDALVPLAALAGDQALYEQYRSRVEEAQTPEERYRFLFALGAFRDPARLRQTLDYALSPRVRTQDRAALIATVLGNPAGRTLAWDVLRERWSDVQQGLGAFGGSARIIQALGSFCSASRADEIRRFFATRQVPGAQRTIAQTVEDVERCAAVRKRQAPLLARFLGARHTARR